MRGITNNKIQTGEVIVAEKIEKKTVFIELFNNIRWTKSSFLDPGAHPYGTCTNDLNSLYE